MSDLVTQMPANGSHYATGTVTLDDGNQIRFEVPAVYDSHNALDESATNAAIALVINALNRKINAKAHSKQKPT
jgi:hypothetical protein